VTVPQWHEEPIGTRHDRDGFDCGDAALNEYLRRFARQAHEHGSAKTFVAVPDGDEARVLGFYTLSAASVAFSRTPEVVRRELGRYEVPAFRLGRLAVHRAVQRQGLGGQLLLAAGRRCLRAAQEVGGVALLIDAKNEAVAEWYAGYGAVRLLDAPLTLLLPLATVKIALAAAGG
jgi:GNAT superfamily N-acetyltransferase